MAAQELMQARAMGKAVESFIVMVCEQFGWRDDRARSRAGER
jgi:hypothetical protein